MNITVIYASEKGSTAEIAERVAYRLEQSGLSTSLINTKQTQRLDQPSGAIILLTPIYKGLWLPAMTHFIRRNRRAIGDTPIFGLFPCVRVLEEQGKRYAYNNYLPDYIVGNLNLVDVRFIAGKLIRKELTLDELQTLSTRYDGEKLNHIRGDYRDWFDILDWTDRVAAIIKDSSPRHAGNFNE